MGMVYFEKMLLDVKVEIFFKKDCVDIEVMIIVENLL